MFMQLLYATVLLTATIMMDKDEYRIFCFVCIQFCITAIVFSVVWYYDIVIVITITVTVYLLKDVAKLFFFYCQFATALW